MAMKSIFLTILIFIGVFFVAGSNVLSIISEAWFHYLSYTMFVCVMIAGVYVTVFRKNKAVISAQPEQENVRKELGQKENDNEK